MPNYLCKEGIELFSMKSENIETAREDAEIYNAVVIREMKPNEVIKQVNGNWMVGDQNE